MTIERMHHNEKRPSPPRRSWAWRAGRLVAACRARRWPKRLAAGVAAWIALGVMTVWLDPRPYGYGVIELFGRAYIDYDATFAWLATGIGLAATGVIGHAQYQRRGWLASLLAGALSLAAAMAVVAVVDWGVVGEVTAAIAAIVGWAFVVAFVVLICRMYPSVPTFLAHVLDSSANYDDEANDEDDGEDWLLGYRVGPGLYDGSGNRRSGSR